MKNKEKYKDKILEIALQHDSIAIDKRTNKLVRCSYCSCGTECLFGRSEDCDKEFIDWLEEEANENEHKFLNELTINNDGFLKIVESGYIARDEIDGDLMFYCEAPTWRDYLNGGYWFSPFNNIRLKNDSFEFIKVGECWAYNIDTNATNKDVIYNITKDLRRDIV